MICALVGNHTSCTVFLAIRLCSWTDILLFYLFERTVKECPPPVIKEMSQQKMMPTAYDISIPQPMHLANPLMPSKAPIPQGDEANTFFSRSRQSSE